MSVQNVNAMAAIAWQPSGATTGQPALSQAIQQEALPTSELKKDVQRDQDVLGSAVDDANKMLAHIRPDIKFVIDDATKDVVIMLVEPETGDVINRYPTEQGLAISNAIAESQARAADQQVALHRASNQVLGLFVEQRT